MSPELLIAMNSALYTFEVRYYFFSSSCDFALSEESVRESSLGSKTITRMLPSACFRERLEIIKSRVFEEQFGRSTMHSLSFLW